MTPDIQTLLLRAAKEDLAMSMEELRANRREQTVSFVQRAIRGISREQVERMYDETMERIGTAAPAVPGKV